MESDPEGPVMETMLNKISIFIPAYNAAPTLPRVLDRIPAHIRNVVGEILIIDNHSQDDTYVVAVGLKQTHNLYNLNVIRNPQNMGYGGSQKIAYQRNIDQGTMGVAMLHGDAQYAPELIGDLLAPVMEGQADLIFGSRMTGDPLAGRMPIHRYLGNRFLTWIQNKLLGASLSEYHSGYRVYSTEALKKVPFDRLSSDYHFDTEIIILFLENKLRIKEVPIPTHYGDEKSHVNVWKYGIDVLVTTVTYYLHKKGWRKSRRWKAILGY